MVQITDLLRSEGDRLYRLLWRLTQREDVAEDLLQELTLKLAESDGFGVSDQPYAYARAAAVNLACDWRRRKRAEPASLDGEVSRPERTGMERMVQQ